MPRSGHAVVRKSPFGQLGLAQCCYEIRSSRREDEEGVLLEGRSRFSTQGLQDHGQGTEMGKGCL